MSNQVLFDDNIEKINNTVQYYPLGSYQVGEIAKLSGLLYQEGVDVVKELEKLCHKYSTEKIYKHISGVTGVFYKRYRVTGTSYFTIMVNTFDGRQFYAPESEWVVV